MHTVSMPNVLIRDLDPEVHATLAARAEAQGQSLQQYLTTELEQLAAQPTLNELFTRVEERKTTGEITREQILDAIQRGRERTQ